MQHNMGWNNKDDRRDTRQPVLEIDAAFETEIDSLEHQHLECCGRYLEFPWLGHNETEVELVMMDIDLAHHSSPARFRSRCAVDLCRLLVVLAVHSQIDSSWESLDAAGHWSYSKKDSQCLLRKDLRHERAAIGLGSCRTGLLERVLDSKAVRKHQTVFAVLTVALGLQEPDRNDYRTDCMHDCFARIAGPFLVVLDPGAPEILMAEVIPIECAEELGEDQ